MEDGENNNPFWKLIDLDPDIIDADPADYLPLGLRQLPGNCIVPAKTVPQ